MNRFREVRAYFQEVSESFREDWCIFLLGSSFPELRNKFREIRGHYGNRGFGMRLNLGRGRKGTG